MTGTFPRDADPSDIPTEGFRSHADYQRARRAAQADPANMNPERTTPLPVDRPSPRSPSPRRGGRRSVVRRPIGRRSSSRPTSPSLTNPTGGRSLVEVSHSASGIVLGAVVYALVLSLVNYGASGPKLWFKAKFLNEAAGIGTGPAGGPSSPYGAGTGGQLKL